MATFVSKQHNIEPPRGKPQHTPNRLFVVTAGARSLGTFLAAIDATAWD